MKKKFTALVLMLIMCLSVFAGCSLITRNDKKYYEAVVCTISYADGTSDNITKRELLMAYNSYGYNYVQQQGKQQAIMTTIDSIVNQRITIKAVEDFYKDPNQILLDSEKTYLYDNTYSSMYSNLMEYYMEVIEASDSSTEDSEVEANKSVFKQYQKQAYLQEENGNLVIKKTTSATTIRDTYKARYDEKNKVLDLNTDASIEILYNKLNSLCSGTSTDAKVWKKAFAKYIKDIKANYSYKNFADDKACMLFEIDRVYQILKDNYFVEKYSVIFNQQQHQGDNTSNVTVNDILKLYSSKVRVDYNTYKKNGDSAGFASNILSDVANVDYILDGDNASDYFYVGYVKINLTEKQKAEIESIKKDANISSEAQRKEEINKVYAKTKATVRNAETGAETDQKIDASVLLNKIKSEVEAHKYKDISISDAANAEEIKAQNKETELARAEAFRPYMYLYSDDDTLKGADFNTVFGVDMRGQVLCSDTFNNDNVKDAIKKLYNNGNAKVGDMTELVSTDEGVYMFFYAGDIQNLFAVGDKFDISTNPNNIKILASTRQNIFSDKTIFDALYEELVADNFSVFQNMNIQNLRSKLVVKDGIKAVKNNIKDLF